MKRIRCHLLAERWREKVNLSAQIAWRESDIIYKLDGEAERRICQHRSHGDNQTSLTLWKVKGNGEFVSTDHMARMRCHLQAERWSRKANLSAQIAWGQSDITYKLEGEGERWICQCRLHGENQVSLTNWKVKGKGEFLSTWIRVSLTCWGEGKGRICQHSSHGENQMSLTSWKVKGKGKFVSTDRMERIRCHLQAGWWSRKANLSAQIASGESGVAYSLEGEGEWWICQHWSHGENQMWLTSWKVKGKDEFISTDHMESIRHHLQAGWWSRKVNSSAQIAWQESDITYSLEGEADRRLCQHRSHGKNQTSLTLWKEKQKGNFVSTNCMGRIRHHLLSGRWREKANLSSHITWEELDITYYLEGKEKRWIHQHRSHGENWTSLTLWKVKRKVNSLVQITWKESDTIYELEGEGERWIHQCR